MAWFICPFCNQRCAVVGAGVVHAMPPCETFATSQPDDYLAAVNDKLYADAGRTAELERARQLREGRS